MLYLVYFTSCQYFTTEKMTDSYFIDRYKYDDLIKRIPRCLRRGILLIKDKTVSVKFSEENKIEKEPSGKTRYFVSEIG